MAFWIAWSIDAIIAAVAVIFFLVGLADGSVSAYNIVLWLGLLAAAAGFVGGSLWLRSKGQRVAAMVLAWIPAVPGLFAGLMMILLIANPPRWN